MRFITALSARLTCPKPNARPIRHSPKCRIGTAKFFTFLLLLYRTSVNADGFKSWGNNTAAYPSTTDPKDRWWAVRRFFDWDGNNFIRTYFQKVDKPGNKRLIQSIVDSQNIIGNGYVARDYCAGYRVEFRSDENPVTNLLDGHLTTHTYLAPYIPAEYIENVREYDVAALKSAIGGE